MSRIKELKAQLLECVEEAGLVVDKAETEKRDLTPEEQAQYDGLIAEAEVLETRISRLEAHESKVAGLEAVTTVPIAKIEAPGVLTIPQGDSEERAMAHYFRTGDKGGLSHLVKPDSRGSLGIEFNVPTARETEKRQAAERRGYPLEQRAAVDSTMNITTAADGANMVPTGFVQDVAQRRNELILNVKLGCRPIPGKGTTVNYPVEAADPEDFAATAEQSDAHDANYERDAGNTGLKAFTLAKKTRKIELTEEILEDNDANLADYISGRIARQMAGTHNGLLLTEVASNGTALKTYAAAAAIAAGEPEDIVFNDSLSYYLEDEGSIGWVMRPTTFGNIASLTGNARLYAETPGGSFKRELLGYGVNYSNKAAATAASAKDVYFGNWDFVGYREAPELRFITDPYSVDGLVILKYSFRTVYGVLQAAAIGYGVHPSA